MDLDRQDAAHDEATAKAIGATVKLATHSLDGLGLSDEELDGLCDAALGAPDADKHKNNGETGKK